MGRAPVDAPSSPTFGSDCGVDLALVESRNQWSQPGVVVKLINPLSTLSGRWDPEVLPTVVCVDWEWEWEWEWYRLQRYNRDGRR